MCYNTERKDMKLKIFLRGLGVGMTFSAIVMLACTSSLSKEFIIEKAKEYGMVMAKDKEADASDTEDNIDKLKDELASEKPDESKEPQPTKTVAPSKEPQPTKTVAPSKEPQPTKTVAPSKEPQPTKTVAPSKEPQPTKTVAPSKEPQPTKTVAPSKEPQSTKKPVSGDKVSFTIKRGMASYSAAKVLEQCGLVDSAKSFDSYLCKNKLDGYVKAGTFTATKGMSYAQLAKIITRK